MRAFDLLFNQPFLIITLIILLVLLLVAAYLFARFRKMTELHRLKVQQLRKVNDRFDLLTSRSDTYFWEVDLDGKYTYVSKSVIGLLGYKPDELVQHHYFYDLIAPLSQQQTKKLGLHYVKKSLPIRDYENPQLTKDNEVRWFITDGRPVYDADNRVVGYQGYDRDVTKERTEELNRLTQEARYRTVITVSNTGAWEYDNATGELWTSPEYYAMLGYNDDQIKMKINNHDLNSWVELMHPEDQTEAVLKFKEYLNKPSQKMYESHFRLKRADGNYAWIWSRGKTIKDELNQYSTITVGTQIDITEMKTLEETMYLEREHFRKTILSVSDGVILITKEGQITLMNQTMTNWLNHDLVGDYVHEVFTLLDGYNQERHIFDQDDDGELTERTLVVNGQTRPIEYTLSAVSDAQNEINGYVMVCRDISDRLEREQEVYDLSYRDQLTGLYNRRFYDSLMRKFNHKQYLPVSIVMVDANGLKLMNDVFGHDQGDDMLKKIANHLTAAVDEEGYVCRVGGDEFVVMLPHTKQLEAKAYIEKVNDTLERDRTHFLPLTISYGHSTKTTVDLPLQHVYRDAEDKMYVYKMSKRSELREQMVDAILQELDHLYPGETAHAGRVTKMSIQIAEHVGLNKSEILQLEAAAKFHDIGKIVLGPELLTKDTPLLPQERLAIKRHPEAGYSILSAVNRYAHLADYILYHHEHYDGTGYPKGLSNSEIPIFSRIIHLAESYDHMRSHHSYRQALPREEVINIITEQCAKQFDPRVVESFLADTIEKY